MTVHASDCAPCDTARALVDQLATVWDPLDNWSECDSVTREHPTLRDEAIAIAADVLHQLLPSQPPTQRPRIPSRTT